MFAGRGVVIRGLGFLSYLVFARLLSPSEIGIAAVGLTLTFLGHFIADAGLGSALVRGPATPDSKTLGALVTLQAGIVSAFALPVCLWAVLDRSQLAVVSALYMVSLLPYVFRGPAAVLLERDLSFRPLIATEILEVVVFNATALIALALGAGVEALAAATIAKTLTGTIFLLATTPAGRVRPARSLNGLRSIVGFGLTIQGNAAVAMARDQLINYGMAAIAGLGVLGIWTLASKIMLLPAVVFESLWRVSFPAFARLTEMGEDSEHLLKRAVGVVAVAISGLMVPLVAGAPEAIPAALGERWADVGVLLPFLSFSTALSVPISTVVTGVLYARGDARSILVVTVAVSATLALVGLGLLPSVGLVGFGIAYAASGVVDAALLSIVVRRALAVDALSPVLGPLCAAIAATTATRVVFGGLEDSIWTGLGAAAAAAAAYVVLIALLQREKLTLAVSLVRRAIASKPVPLADGATPVGSAG